jgi:hypothetical protein
VSPLATAASSTARSTWPPLTGDETSSRGAVARGIGAELLRFTRLRPARRAPLGPSGAGTTDERHRRRLHQGANWDHHSEVTHVPSRAPPRCALPPSLRR